jgi:hypothetical protein
MKWPLEDAENIRGYVKVNWPAFSLHESIKSLAHFYHECLSLLKFFPYKAKLSLDSFLPFAEET